MTIEKLSASDLDLEIENLALIMTQQKFVIGTELWQAVYYPTDFLPFSITMVRTEAFVDLVFTSLIYSAARIDLALEETSGKYSDEEIKSSYEKYRQYLAGLTTNEVLWQEKKVLAFADFEKFRRELDLIFPMNLRDANAPCLDGMLGIGKILKLGYMTHAFTVKCLSQEQHREHYKYFAAFLNFASEHLDEERSLNCLIKLKESV